MASDKKTEEDSAPGQPARATSSPESIDAPDPQATGNRNPPADGASLVRIDARPEVSWWRPLVQWILCLPHLAYTAVLQQAAFLLAIVIGVILLVTGRMPAKLATFQVFSLRERARTYSYLWLLRSDHPPFTHRVTADDPGDDPLITVSGPVPARAPRWSLVVRPILCLHHLAVLLPVGLLMDLLYPLAMLVIAGRGGWPARLTRFLVEVERWVVSLARYLLLATNERPRFGFSAYAP